MSAHTCTSALQNIPFLINVMSDPDFLKGELNTRYIENHPKLLQIKNDSDQAHKLIHFLAEVNANGIQREPGSLKAAKQGWEKICTNRHNLTAGCSFFYIWNAVGKERLQIAKRKSGTKQVRYFFSPSFVCLVAAL